MVILDMAQQREHDRKVAEAAVARARVEWEREFQNQLKTQVIVAPTAPAAPAPAPAKTIIQHSKFFIWRKTSRKYLMKLYVILLGVPSFTSLEVRRQKEEELRKNDSYWQSRLKQQEIDLKKTAALMEQEYNATVCKVFLFKLCGKMKSKNLSCFSVQ